MTIYIRLPLHYNWLRGKPHGTGREEKLAQVFLTGLNKGPASEDYYVSFSDYCTMSSQSPGMLGLSLGGTPATVIGTYCNRLS
jgi:hypothetical protein